MNNKIIPCDGLTERQREIAQKYLEITSCGKKISDDGLVEEYELDGERWKLIYNYRKVLAEIRDSQGLSMKCY